MGVGGGGGGGGLAAAPTADPTTSPSRSPLTTHVLDTAAGRPAAGVPVTLLARPPGAPPRARLWVAVGKRGAATDGDGRVGDLLPVRGGGWAEPAPGAYRLEFGMAGKVAAGGGGEGGGEGGGPPAPTWSPTPAVEFEVGPSPTPPGRHWHVPLTWAPHGYGTYRGS